MAASGPNRITTAPADTREMPASHGALVAAAKDAFPGLPRHSIATLESAVTRAGPVELLQDAS